MLVAIPQHKISHKEGQLLRLGHTNCVVERSTNTADGTMPLGEGGGGEEGGRAEEREGGREGRRGYKEEDEIEQNKKQTEV